MKMKLVRQLFFAAVLVTSFTSASAQIYVRIRPTYPVVARPPQPAPHYVWVNEEWEPNGKEYRYAGGHWEAPTKPGYYRTQGHWQRTKHGQRWIPGSWKGQQKKGKHHKRK